jgi:hypothetical protein
VRRPPRLRSPALLVALLAAALLATGCGGGSDPGEAVTETAKRLGEIRSGELQFSAALKTDGGEPFAMELDGPFSIEKEGLAVTEMRSTRVIGGERVEATLISTGDRVWVKAPDGVQELTGEQAEALQIRAGTGGLADLDLDLGAWIDSPESEDAGPNTERISGTLDLAAALDDLARAAKQELPADVRERLVDSVKESSVELVTGKEDRLLRKLKVRATFDVPSDLEPLIGTGGIATLELDAVLEKINQPVTVEPPA